MGYDYRTSIDGPFPIPMRLRALTCSSFCGLKGWRLWRSPRLFYARTGASWWLFAALWLTPDLSMLGYLGGPKVGARIYNAIHSYVTPATLAVTGLLLKSPALLPYALIWMNHIGADRLLGYGLSIQRGSNLRT